MYITINDIKGEKELTYLTQFRILTPARRLQLSECLATMINMRYWNFMQSWILFQTRKRGTYAGRELLCIVEGMGELNQFVVDDQIIKKNKLKGIMEMIINLDELNNSNNLEDGHPSNTLLTYHVTDDKDFTHFDPQIPQYRALKNGEFRDRPLFFIGGGGVTFFIKNCLQAVVG